MVTAQAMEPTVPVLEQVAADPHARQPFSLRRWPCAALKWAWRPWLVAERRWPTLRRRQTQVLVPRIASVGSAARTSATVPGRISRCAKIRSRLEVVMPSAAAAA